MKDKSKKKGTKRLATFRVEGDDELSIAVYSQGQEGNDFMICTVDEANFILTELPAFLSAFAENRLQTAQKEMEKATRNYNNLKAIVQKGKKK